jgi:hypothetical protein
MLQQVCPGIWVHDGWKWFYGFVLHRWMTVIALADNRLVVHSPNRLDAGLRAELDRLGQVTCVIAPNKMHHYAVDQFAAAYPKARFFAAPGLPQRRPDLRFDRELGSVAEPEWASVLDQAALAGNRFFTEIVLFHRATRTLIVTDFIENLYPETVGPAGNCVARLLGIWKNPSPSPEHSMYLTDLEAFERSIQRVRSWDFDRILLAHGRFIETGGKAIFEAVVQKLATRVRRRGPIRRRLYRFLAKRQ